MREHRQPAPDTETSAIAAELAPLEHRVRSLAEAPMRAAVVREWIQTRGADGLYDLLCFVLGRSPGGGSTFDPLLEAIHQLLQASEPELRIAPELRAKVYTRALDAEATPLLRLLRSAGAARECDADARQLPRDIADIPLGRRRSLAKGFDRRMLERLAQDPDPTVIRNLLKNPRIRESDVLRLASTRPVAATTLQVIGSEARWSQRPLVRAALARNPYSPVALALQMLNGLGHAELRDIADDRMLHADVRAHARQCCEVRGAAERRDRKQP